MANLRDYWTTATPQEQAEIRGKAQVVTVYSEKPLFIAVNKTAFKANRNGMKNAKIVSATDDFDAHMEVVGDLGDYRLFQIVA